MVERKYTTGATYKYGFNGKEAEKEVAVDNYDFGARIYDGRVGRFLSVDFIFKKLPAISHYSFAENSPVLSIDYEGLFKLSKRDQKKYPQLTILLKNMNRFVKENPEIYKAFVENMKISEKQANKILEWGSGPKVKVKDTDAYAKTGSNILFSYGKQKINADLIQSLEDKNVSKTFADTEDGVALAVIATVLHEAQHNIMNKKGPIRVLRNSFRYDPSNDLTEDGRRFEKKAFGKVLESKADFDSKAKELKTKAIIRVIQKLFFAM